MILHVSDELGFLGTLFCLSKLFMLNAFVLCFVSYNIVFRYPFLFFFAVVIQCGCFSRKSRKILSEFCHKYICLDKHVRLLWFFFFLEEQLLMLYFVFLRYNLLDHSPFCFYVSCIFCIHQMGLCFVFRFFTVIRSTNP